jgi:hypothetical protein
LNGGADINLVDLSGKNVIDLICCPAYSARRGIPSGVICLIEEPQLCLIEEPQSPVDVLEMAKVFLDFCGWNERHEIYKQFFMYALKYNNTAILELMEKQNDIYKRKKSN